MHVDVAGLDVVMFSCRGYWGKNAWPSVDSEMDKHSWPLLL